MFIVEEDSIRETLDQVQPQDNSVSDLLDQRIKEDQSLDSSPISGEIATPVKLKREDSKMRTFSGRHVVNCRGKNVRINIPLTTPTRTLSALSDLSVWDDLVSPSKKSSPGRTKLQINKTKLHHAEKMIRGAFIELYKGLGYLKTYRYYIQLK